MSNHVATITKDEGRCSFSRKALSVFMAVLLAFLMMPMVPAESALADVVNPADAFANGTAVAATNQDGIAVSPDENGVYTLTADGSAKSVWPSYIVPEGATEQVAVKVVKFVKEDKTEQINSANIKDAGTYYAVVTPEQTGTAYGTAECLVKFVLAAPGLDGLTIFEDHGDKTTGDTTFTFDNAAQKIGFAIDGKQIAYDINSPSSSPENDKQVVVTFYNAKGEKLKNGTADIVAAGDYKAVVRGKTQAEIEAGTTAKYAGASATIPFTVEQLDLEKASFVVNDVATSNAAYDTIQSGATVDGTPVASLNTAEEDPNVVFSADPVSVVGTYSATVSAADGQGNVVGSKTVSFNAVDKVVESAAITYDGAELAKTLKNKVFDLSKKDKFDADEIAVSNGEGGYYELDEDYTVTLTNEEGEAVANADSAGKYTVTVAMIPGSDYALGGKATATFTVINGDFSQAAATVTYKGTIVGDNAPIVYTGSDVLKDIAVSVKWDKKELSEGSDYTVAFSQDGKEIEQAVDCGSYTMTIEGISYDGKIDFNFSIAQATITGLRVQQMASGLEGVPYTGEAVVPVIEYTLDDADAIAADTAEWHVLPSDQYKAEYKDAKDETVRPENLKEVGKGYKVVVALNSLAKNIKLGKGVENELAFDIVETAHFIDVPADAWYADGVYTAWENTYMEGIAEGIFAPENAMTRAEFAQLVFNMAGGKKDTVGKEYPTQFADVPANAWYAQAVEWAARYGIVNGTSETTFAPNETISREQIATMFYRYAGNKAQADLAVLDQFADAESVSDWAETAMAWAVENGYVNGTSETTLAPAETASRAQIAVIAVRIQPDPVTVSA